jgi:hypothetical protein
VILSETSGTPSFFPDFTSKPSKMRVGLMLFCLRGGLQFFAFEQEEDRGAGGNSSEERIIDPQSKKNYIGFFPLLNPLPRELACSLKDKYHLENLINRKHLQAHLEIPGKQLTL